MPWGQCRGDSEPGAEETWVAVRIPEPTALGSELSSVSESPTWAESLAPQPVVATVKRPFVLGS